MRRLLVLVLAAIGAGLVPPPVWCDAPAPPAAPMTLRQAQDYALAHHPEIQAAGLQAQAADQVVRETRAAFFPQAVADLTGVAAGDSTRVAASGGLNNPSVFQRESNGLLVSQLITDFGRTSALTASSRFQAESAAQAARTVRARVLLEVNRAYFGVLGAKALVMVAQQTVEDRRLTLDRVSALAKANLKSSLDVSFAEVALGDATLLELRAKDRLDAAYAELATALGSRDEGVRALAEEPLPPPPPEDIDSLVRSALADRPELLAFRAQRDATLKMASAEKAERYPVVAAIGAVGFSPYRDDRLQPTYATAGVNVSVPVLTGGRLSAREQEAALRASAAARTLDDQENRIERDVRTSWLDARTAFKAIAITEQLLDSASRALELAESRYNLGISSIVELSQAQLQKTQAEIADATARYDYQLKRADLEFQVGTLR